MGDGNMDVLAKLMDSTPTKFHIYMLKANNYYSLYLTTVALFDVYVGGGGASVFTIKVQTTCDYFDLVGEKVYFVVAIHVFSLPPTYRYFRRMCPEYLLIER